MVVMGGYVHCHRLTWRDGCAVHRKSRESGRVLVGFRHCVCTHGADRRMEWISGYRMLLLGVDLLVK